MYWPSWTPFHSCNLIRTYKSDFLRIIIFRSLTVYAPSGPRLKKMFAHLWNPRADSGTVKETSTVADLISRPYASPSTGWTSACTEASSGLASAVATVHFYRSICSSPMVSTTVAITSSFSSDNSRFQLWGLRLLHRHHFMATQFEKTGRAQWTYLENRRLVLLILRPCVPLTENVFVRTCLLCPGLLMGVSRLWPDFVSRVFNFEWR